MSTPCLHFISTYRVDAAVEVGQQAEAGLRVLQSSSDPPCQQHWKMNVVRKKRQQLFKDYVLPSASQ